MSINRGTPPPRQGGVSGQGRRDNRYQSAPPSELPPDYLKSGYFDENGNLLEAVIITWPKKLASDLTSELHRGRKLKTAQLRRFFSEVKRIEKKLKVSGDFYAIRSEILKLDGYAEDAVKKDKAPPLFRKFINQNIRWAAKNEKDFLTGFVNHFECLVAFFPETK